MSVTNWTLVLVAAHLVIACSAIFITRRARYTRLQLAVQAALAVLLPVVGAVVVIAMAREALAAPPGPDTTSFTPEYRTED